MALKRTKLSALVLLALAIFISEPALAQASIESAESDGEKVTLTLHVPGGNFDGVGLYRMKTSAGFWTRLRASYVLDENGNWTTAGPRPTNDPNRFLRDDTFVDLGEEYCYVSNTGGGSISTDNKVCVIHQPLGSNLQFPSAPTNLSVPKFNIHNLTLEFEDTANNEAQFIVERRFSHAPWETIALLPEEPGTGARVKYRERDLEMFTQYCYRVTATNSDGSRMSNVKCRRTGPAVVPSVSPPETGRGYLSNLSHYRTDGLAVTFVYAKADVDRSFTVALYRRDNLDGNPVRMSTVRIRSTWPHLASSARFDDLDPTAVYCARIKTQDISPDRFDPRILCESPFGRRTETTHLGPSADDLPNIVVVTSRIGGLQVQLDKADPNLFIDMVEAKTGLRETRLEPISNTNAITINGLNHRAIYCVRTVVSNEYGSRYGRLVCAETRGITGGGGGGGVGGTSGGSGSSDHLTAGVDCNCNATGAFVDPVTPASGAASSDGLYRVEQTGSSVSVFRNSDNERVFNETSLNAGFAFGFGPRTRYFMLAERQDLDRVAVSVHDLEGETGDKRKFLDTNVVGSSGFGFSPDGRTFMLARMIATGQLGINLVNLRKPNLTTGVLTFQRPFSGFWQFSPCGDAFATGLGPSPTGTPFVSLFQTVDKKAIKTGFNLPGDFTGISSTDSDHVIVRASGANVPIGPNTAGQACMIPGSAAGGYELQTIRYGNVLLSSSAADTIYADASSILQTNDGPGDVACDVTFERSGPVVSSSFGDGSIDSEAELDAMFDEPGVAKAVDQINFCGEMEPGLLGCAPLPGTTFVFVRGEEEAGTVAHEFGHNKGLEHREDDPDALMFPSGSLTANKVNDVECAAFLSQGSATMSFRTPDVMIQPYELHAEINRAISTQPLMPIQDFVRRSYYEGIPYHMVQEYDDSVIPTLLNMLNDPNESKSWSNIVKVLGMLGDERVVPPMIAFIERDFDSMSRSEYRAKTTAIMSLGYVINRTGDDRALRYLAASLSPDTWRDRRIKGLAPYQKNIAARDTDLSKSAILALALAGTPEARRLLQSLQERGKTAQERKFREAHPSLIESAIQESREIGEKGLKEYYRQP